MGRSTTSPGRTMVNASRLRGRRRRTTLCFSRESRAGPGDRFVRSENGLRNLTGSTPHPRSVRSSVSPSLGRLPDRPGCWDNRLPSQRDFRLETTGSGAQSIEPGQSCVFGTVSKSMLAAGQPLCLMEGGCLNVITRQCGIACSRTGGVFRVRTCASILHVTYASREGSEPR